MLIITSLGYRFFKIATLFEKAVKYERTYCHIRRENSTLNRKQFEITA